MVEMSEIARMAMRYDTVVALAFRRALGIAAAPVARSKRGARPEGRLYAGMRWCMENHGSPMDGR